MSVIKGLGDNNATAAEGARPAEPQRNYALAVVAEVLPGVVELVADLKVLEIQGRGSVADAHPAAQMKPGVAHESAIGAVARGRRIGGRNARRARYAALTARVPK